MRACGLRVAKASSLSSSRFQPVQTFVCSDVHTTNWLYKVCDGRQAGSSHTLEVVRDTERLEEAELIAARFVLAGPIAERVVARTLVVENFLQFSWRVVGRWRLSV